jgi:aspartyl-tRNA(Asn)/glutamyl-tRNA(Gln) amidotransferase subunit B
MEWEVIIGFETHAQLSTQSKIFSGASTAFGAEPNAHACAVDIALPGVLPVINRGAVERAIRFGLAVGGKISRRSVFARKNYFYPDLPKGYQISQYELPIVSGGAISFQLDGAQKTVQLTRAHLEEDAGKSLHEDFHGLSGIDLNRAGTPLLEIVTEPDMRSSNEAVAYAKTLHSLVRWIDICDGNMEEGSFRCDANVSVRRQGDTRLGTRREIKNLNSFRFLQQAIDYEVRWQIETLQRGGEIRQATVLFDPDRGETRPMRSKEDAHDYRYFPDPDLLPLEVSEAWIEQIRASLTELPAAKRQRFMREYGLAEYDAQTLTASKGLASYFETVAQAVTDKTMAAHWVMGEVLAQLNRDETPIDDASITAEEVAQLITRVLDGTITAHSAKAVFRDIWLGGPKDGKDRPNIVDATIEKLGLKQTSDAAAVEKIIDEILTANAGQVIEYRGGKEKAFNFLVGQAMKATKGTANPIQVNDILKRKLAG